jgi:hypothetical protein
MLFYDIIEITNNIIKIDMKEYKAIFGKHEIYLPDKEEKYIFTVNGNIVSLGQCRIKDEMIRSNKLFENSKWSDISIESIVNEYSLLRYMADMNITPPIGELIFVKKAIVKINEFAHIDTMGMFGYQMKNAMNIVKGKFTNEIVTMLRHDGIIKCSDGAFSDLSNKSRNNVINGYCVDVRRSLCPDLPYYNNFNFSGKKDKIYDMVRRVVNE